MKKMKFCTGLLCVSLLFAACEKNPDELTVTINQSGSATIKVVDKSRNAIEGATVSIDLSNYYPLYDGITGKDGVVFFETLLQSTYQVSATVQKGKAVYFDSKLLQVIADKNITVELSPLSNVGDVTVRLRNRSNGEAIMSVLNIALVPDGNYISNINDIKNSAHFIDKTNADGVFKFADLPASARYEVYVFTTSDQIIHTYYNTYFTIKKGIELFHDIEIYI